MTGYLRSCVCLVLIALQFCSIESSVLVIKSDSPIALPDCPIDDDIFNPTQLPNPKNCSQFYKCQSGMGYLMDCPSGLHWSVEFNRCDWPHIAKCTPVQLANLYNFIEKISLVKDDNTIIQNPNCPTIDDPENPIHLAYPDDCTKFYTCSGGYAYLMSCPSNLYWSVELNRCDYPFNSKCQQNVISLLLPIKSNQIFKTVLEEEKPIPHPDCPIDENPVNPTHLAYPGDCTKFYKCQYGLAYPMACPANLHWSVEFNRCDWPHIANCQTLALFNQMVRKTGEPIPNDKCPLIDDPKLVVHLPYPNDCTKFYKCSYGLAYPMDCPINQHWSIKLDRCDWPTVAGCVVFTTTTTKTTTTSTTTVKPSTNTTKSTSTVHTTTASTSKPIHTTTPNPNPTTAGCRKNPELTIQPHPTDCTKFILCDHGDGQVMNCPDNLHYSVVTRRCEQPADAKCQL